MSVERVTPEQLQVCVQSAQMAGFPSVADVCSLAAATIEALERELREAKERIAELERWQARALEYLEKRHLDIISRLDAAREILEKARERDLIGPKLVETAMERDKALAKNAVLREHSMGNCEHSHNCEQRLRSALAQLDAPKKPCERAGCTNGFGGCKHV